MWDIASDVLTQFDLGCDSDSETVEIRNPEEASNDSARPESDDRIETIDTLINNDDNMAPHIKEQMAQNQYNSFSIRTLCL